MGGHDHYDPPHIDTTKKYISYHASIVTGMKPAYLFPMVQYISRNYDTRHTKFYLQDNNDAGSDVYYLTGGGYKDLWLVQQATSDYNTHTRGVLEGFAKEWIKNSKPVSEYINKNKKPIVPGETIHVPYKNEYTVEVPANVWKPIAGKILHAIVDPIDKFRYGSSNQYKPEQFVTPNDFVSQKDYNLFVNNAKYYANRHGRNFGRTTSRYVQFGDERPVPSAWYWFNFRDSIDYRLKSFGNDPITIVDDKNYRQARAQWAWDVTKTAERNTKKIQNVEQMVASLKNDLLAQLTGMKTFVELGDLDLEEKYERDLKDALNKGLAVVGNSAMPQSQPNVQSQALVSYNDKPLLEKMNLLEGRIDNAEKKIGNSNAEKDVLNAFNLIGYGNVKEDLGSSNLIDISFKDLPMRDLSSQMSVTSKLVSKINDDTKKDHDFITEKFAIFADYVHDSEKVVKGFEKDIKDVREDFNASLQQEELKRRSYIKSTDEKIEGKSRIFENKLKSQQKGFNASLMKETEERRSNINMINRNVGDKFKAFENRIKEDKKAIDQDIEDIRSETELLNIDLNAKLEFQKEGFNVSLMKEETERRSNFLALDKRIKVLESKAKENKKEKTASEIKNSNVGTQHKVKNSFVASKDVPLISTIREVAAVEKKLNNSIVEEKQQRLKRQDELDRAFLNLQRYVQGRGEGTFGERIRSEVKEPIEESIVYKLKKDLIDKNGVIYHALFDVYANNRKGLVSLSTNDKVYQSKSKNIRVVDQLAGIFFKRMLLNNLLVPL